MIHPPKLKHVWRIDQSPLDIVDDEIHAGGHGVIGRPHIPATAACPQYQLYPVFAFQHLQMW